MILAAARSEFAERGYAGARVARIAERTGLNKQLIYYYFQSKAGLYAAAVDPTGEEDAPPSSAVSPSSSAPDAVRAAIARLFASLQNRPELIALMVDRHPAPDARVQARAWLSNAEADVAAAVSRGQGMGYFRDDADPDTVARQVVVLCVGALALHDHLGLDTGEWVRGASDMVLRTAVW
jgi:TetR/AcrR family transcriptional regulator